MENEVAATREEDAYRAWEMRRAIVHAIDSAEAAYEGGDDASARSKQDITDLLETFDFWFPDARHLPPAEGG